MVNPARLAVLVLVLAIAMILPLLPVPAAAAPTPGPVRTVQVEGRGTTEEAAKRDAFRNAAEQAFGAVVRAETRVENHEVVADRVKTSAEAFVKSYRVVDRRREPDGTWAVTYEVVLTVESIKDSLEALRILADRLGNPRFMVVEDHRAAGDRADAEVTGAAVSAVHRQLTGRLLDVVDQARVARMKADDEAAAGDQATAAQRIARALHADVYVTVYGHVARTASVNVRFFESATGRILGEESGYSRATSGQADRGEAVDEAMAAATGKAFETMLAYWRRDTDQGQAIPVVAYGLDFGRKVRFRKLLVSIAREVKQISASSGYAEFLVWSDKPPDELSEEIFEKARAEDLGLKEDAAPEQRGNRLIFNFK